MKTQTLVTLAMTIFVLSIFIHLVSLFGVILLPLVNRILSGFELVSLHPLLPLLSMAVYPLNTKGLNAMKNKPSLSGQDILHLQALLKTEGFITLEKPEGFEASNIWLHNEVEWPMRMVKLVDISQSEYELSKTGYYADDSLYAKGVGLTGKDINDIQTMLRNEGFITLEKPEGFEASDIWLHNEVECPMRLVRMVDITHDSTTDGILSIRMLETQANKLLANYISLKLSARFQGIDFEVSVIQNPDAMQARYHPSLVTVSFCNCYNETFYTTHVGKLIACNIYMDVLMDGILESIKRFMARNIRK